MDQSSTTFERRSFLKGVAALGALAAAGPALAACGSSPSSPSGGSSTLTMGLNREWISVDTKRSQFDGQLTLLRAVRQGLTGLGAQLEVVNLLAESFTLSNPTSYEVKLRDGLTFSDGKPIVADDVKTAMESFAGSPDWGLKGQFPEIPTVEVVDDRTLRLVTQAPVPSLPRLMSNITVIPASVNKPTDVDDAPSTGPYKIESFNKGKQTVTLVKNDKFRGGKAAGPARVVGRYFADENARIAALRNGEIQVADSLTPDAAASLESVGGIKIVRNPGTRLSHLAYNFRNPTSQAILNPAVREALSFAIDGESIIKDLLLNSVSPLQGVIPGTLQGAANVGAFKYDPDEAKARLKAAGAENLKVRIIFEDGEFFSIPQVMESVADMLAKVGVRAELKEFTPGGDIGEWRLGNGEKWDVLGNGLGNQTGAALDTLLAWAGTPEKEKERATYHGFVFPKVTNAILAASQEVEPQKQTELLKVAQEELFATWPAMWGFVQNNVTGYRDNVTGIEVAPNNIFDLTKVSVGS